MNSTRMAPDWSFKILFIGDSSVGKTCLMFRFAENSFTESLKPTIGIDFKIKTITLRGKIIKLQLWDTAGQEKFFNIARNYYRNADAILLVYDRTEANTFQNVTRWMRNIDENAPDDVLTILVGNKSDLRHRLIISSEEGKALADKYHVDFFETTAKLENENSVKEMFEFLADKLITRKQRVDPKSIQLDPPTSNLNANCCFSTRMTEK